MYLVHSRTEGPVEALPPEGTRKITKKPDTVFSPFGIFRVWNCFLDFFAYLCGAFEQLFELWCNGNTADFGSVVLGSNPGSSTRKGGHATAFFVEPELLPAILPDPPPGKKGFFGHAPRRHSGFAISRRLFRFSRACGRRRSLRPLRPCPRRKRRFGGVFPPLGRRRPARIASLRPVSRRRAPASLRLHRPRGRSACRVFVLSYERSFSGSCGVRSRRACGGPFRTRR